MASLTTTNFSLAWKISLTLIGIAFVGASIASTLIGSWISPKPVGQQKDRLIDDPFSIPTSVASLNQNAVDTILGRNIFNSEGGAENEPPVERLTDSSSEAVKSDLPVKLMGTIYGGDPLSGIAMVENSNKRTINSFMVGDTLLQDAMVSKVLRERIIIERTGGKLEFIEVDKPELTRSRRSKAKARRPASSGPAPIATDPPPNTFKEDGFERVNTDVTMTQAYKSKLLSSDFTKVLQDAKATPNMVDGELRGFRVDRIRQDSIYQKLGMQNGDIVQEINGIPLNDTAQAIRTLQGMREEKEFEVRISRGGSNMRLNLNVR